MLGRLNLLVVFDFALLESLVHASLDLFAKSIHLIRLPLNEGRLSSYNLLVSLLHVALPLFLLHLLALYLNLVRLGILLLACKLLLDLLKVK